MSILLRMLCLSLGLVLLAPAVADGIYAPTYLTGWQGERGFNELLDETNAYLNEIGAVGVVGELDPDLVVVDLGLGDGPDGIQLIRFLVAEAGVLLARVTQVKRKGIIAYVGVDAGMNSLIRPALYGAWHGIWNLSRLGEPAAMTATVVGPICESGDTLGADRRLPETRPGDVLLIATAGAYGRAMSSHYNLRPPAAELVLE